MSPDAWQDGSGLWWFWTEAQGEVVDVWTEWRQP